MMDLGKQRVAYICLCERMVEWVKDLVKNKSYYELQTIENCGKPW